MQNPKIAAMGEWLEWCGIYPNLADVADKEGFSKIAKTFCQVISYEVNHK